MSRLIKQIATLQLCSVCTLFTQSSFAGGFDGKDFSLRLPAALNRFSSYSDVAGTGGASAGSKWQTSINPAATAWQTMDGKLQLSLNPQYAAILFDQGTVLHVASESITKDIGRYGTAQLSFAQVHSNERPDRQGIHFGYEMNYVQLQWGRHLTENFAAGLNLNYSSAETTNKIDSMLLAKNTSDSYGIRSGLLYRVMPNLLTGLVVEYAYSPAKTDLYDLFASGTGDLVLYDHTRQFAVRSGPSYEYAKDSTVNLDYQYISLENSTGELSIHRFYAGIDHRVVDALFLRTGFVVDTHGNNSWTGGVGIYPLKLLGIDVGYQYNMFPEIQPEFGRAHLITLSLSLAL